MFLKRIILISLILFLPAAACASLRPIQPVVGNIDNSTIADEIITTSFDGNLYAWKADRTLLDGNWPVKFDGFVCAKPALLNLDKNPNDLEILVPVCDYSGKYYLYGLQGSGNIIRGWIKELNFAVYSGPAVGKIDNKKVVFLGTQDGLVYAYDVDPWQLRPGWPKDFGSGKVVSTSLADLNADKKAELIVTSGAGRIVAADNIGGEWNIISELNVDSGIACPAASADLDGDGKLELIVGASNGTIYVWTYDEGKLNPSWSLLVGDAILSSPIIANMDDDKELEIACYSTDGKLNIINNDGSLIEDGLIGGSGGLSPERKGDLLPGILGNEIFFSQAGSYVSNIYNANPKFSMTEWGIFHHMKQPIVVDLSANPDPFSPNSDGRKDTTSITSQIEASSSCKGSLSIYDSNFRLMKVLKNGEFAGTSQTVWDGSGDSGGFASSESYSILLQLESELSDKISQLSSVVVDTIKPFFVSFNVTPEVITPSQSSLFGYYPSEASQLLIVLSNADGEIYKTHSEFLDPDGTTLEAYEFEWDGSGDHNEIFSGAYTYVATLEDPAGNRSDPMEGLLTVDIDAPFINGVYAEPEVFSTVSEINSTSIYFSVAEEANAWLKINNSEDSLVKTLLSGEVVSKGVNSVIWNGADESDVFQPDGHYTFKIEAMDFKGNVSATVENTVEIDSTPPSILQVSVVPDEFSPQAENALSALSFFLSEKADLMIEIIDSADEVVKPLANENLVPAGNYSYEWDGTNGDDVAVEDGDYAFRIVAIDEAGNVRIVKKDVVANSLPPSITNVSVDPGLFTPNSARSNSWTRIRYSLSGGIGDVQIDLNILDASMGTVKKLLNDEITMAGNYSELWYGDVDVSGGIGDDNDDGFADGGEYFVEIIAKDSQGNEFRAEASVEVVEAPTVTAYVSPTTFSPSQGQTTTFYYTINYSELLEGNALVKIRISNDKGEKVYEFADSVFRGDYTHVWDGSNNQGGGFVPDGIYTLKLLAEDPEGNNVITYSNNVIVDGSGPTISINGANPNPFIPNIFEITAFDFSVTSDSPVYYVDPVRIFDSGDNLIKTLNAGQIVWDGSIDGAFGDSNGDGLADEGVYTFRIRATDEVGNESIEEADILVNRVVLHLSEPATPLSPVNFSPVVLGSTSITFTLGRTSAGPALGSSGLLKSMSAIQAVQPIGIVTVEVRDLSGALIRTVVPNMADNGERDAGTYQVDWDGRDEGGAIVPDGEYIIRITAFDLFGNPAETESILTYGLIIDSSPPTGAIVINSGDNFTNDLNVILNLAAGDLLSGVVSMKLSNDGVFDAEAVEDFVLTKLWLLESGDDGDRPVYVQFMDGAGNWSTDEISDSIILDTTPPEITGVYADPQYFSPAESIGTKDATNITFTLNESAEVTVNIAGIGNILTAGNLDAGVNSCMWDPGASVSEGTYYFTIYATDEVGNGTQTTGIDSTIVDNTLPVAAIDLPITDSWLRASFDVIGDAYDENPDPSRRIELSICGSGEWGQLGPIVVGNASNEVLLNFDSRDADDGDYDVRLVVEDKAGNSVYSQTLYHFDNTPPEQPTYLTATTEDSAANLSWRPITTPEVSDVYNIYRSSAYNGTYTKVGSMPAVGSFYQDTGLTNGIRYWYKITAGDKAGNETDYTNYVAAIPGILSNTKISYNRRYDVYTMHIDGSGKTFVRTAWNHAYSPDGFKIVYSLSPTDDRLFIMNSDGSGSRVLVDRGVSYHPSFHPDGTRVVFSSYRDGTGYHIYTINIDGTDEKKLTSSSSFVFNMQASYSPDGKKIFYQTNTGQSHISYSQAIRVMNVDGTNNEFFVYGKQPAISADGTKIAYLLHTYHDSKYYNQLWSINMDGTNNIMLTENIGQDAGSSARTHFSPDNTNIVFIHLIWVNNNSDDDVYRINVNGTGQMNLTNEPSHDLMPFWIPFPSPLVGSALSASAEKIQTQSLSVTPECVSPINGLTVQSLRPTFKWHGLKGVTDYRIECAAASDEASLLNTFDYFTPTISYDQAMEDKPLGAFTIPDHQTGLDENDSDFNSEPFWYWRVKAISSESTIATSEVASFKIQLPVSVSGVINYPNPFDPNKEETRIRYRLGREADNVTIRIYDITGGLVCELDGDIRSEGSSVFDKYNEVEWDGRNGRGDTVVNGVYPFEVLVRSGDKTVSGRGKIVVLK